MTLLSIMVYYWKKWFVCFLPIGERQHAAALRKHTGEKMKQCTEAALYPVGSWKSLQENVAASNPSWVRSSKHHWASSISKLWMFAVNTLLFFGFVHLQRLDLHANRKSGYLCNLLHHLMSRTAQLGATRTPSLFTGPHSLPRLPFGWWAHICTTMQCCLSCTRCQSPDVPSAGSLPKQNSLSSALHSAQQSTLPTITPLAHSWWFCGEPAIT